MGNISKETLKKAVMHFLLENHTNKIYTCSTLVIDNGLLEPSFRWLLEHQEYWEGKKPEPFDFCDIAESLEPLVQTFYDEENLMLTVVLTDSFFKNEFIKKTLEKDNNLMDFSLKDKNNDLGGLIKMLDVEIDEKKQKFEINEKTLDSFEHMMEKINIEDNKLRSEYKAGIATIYAIIKYSNKHSIKDFDVAGNKKTLELQELLNNYKYFKNNFNKNRPFNDAGTEKHIISPKDCDYANSIFKKYGSKTRFKYNKDNKTIRITP